MQTQSQYDPGYAAFGGGATSSVLHPAVLVTMIAVGLLMFLLPRKYVIFPLIVGLLLTPYGQNVYLGGVHLFVNRILILLGWARILSSKPASTRLLPGGFGTVDKIFVVWAIYRAFAVILLFAQTGAIVNQVGFLLDSLGAYFLFRSLICDKQDVEMTLKAFVVVAAVCAAGMLREQLTGQNLFGLLGGIRATPDVRDGKLRAQGAFAISIAAGTFGATTFPLCIWLWSCTKARSAAIVGAASSIVMVFASASSTPVMAWLGSIVAICFWPIRTRMRWVRWSIVIAIMGLHLVMKAPVWYIIARVDFVGGSGYNRAALIDTFFRHFGDWWLIGTRDNVNWGWDMWDQCNQFVSEGETGGLVAFICFIAMIVVSFKIIGKARQAARDRRREWLTWLLGATMFAQVMAYMGIDYFDQSKFAWFSLLVIIPVATAGIRERRVKKSSNLMHNPTLAVALSEPSTEVGGRALSSESSIPYRWFD